MAEKELSLLLHQYELIKDDKTRILGMVAGLAAGKTFAIARKAILLMFANKGFDGIITEPNHPLLIQILIPEMREALDFFEVPYKLNKAEMIFYVYPDGVETRIICKSLENYDRLIGVNAAWVLMDEFDTTKSDTAYMAYLKLLGRIRVGNVNQMVIVSTPEGFKAMYRIFVEEKDKGDKRLIRARTSDNRHLDSTYIQSLIDIYPAAALQAYLEGEFVNLTQGTVYTGFSDACYTDAALSEPTLHIGMDFNVTNMNAVVCQEIDRKAQAIDELTGLYDTPAMIKAIKKRYPNHKIIVYPDSSGGARKTVDASSSDISLLRQAGFIVMADKKNPPVKDRIMSVNAALENGTIKINFDKCPVLVESLRKQAYNDKGEPDKQSGYDHITEALGYYVNYKFPIVRKSAKTFNLKGV